MTAVYTPITPGAILQTNCKHHGTSPHVFQPGKTPPLACQICQSEKESEVKP